MRTQVLIKLCFLMLLVCSWAPTAASNTNAKCTAETANSCGSTIIWSGSLRFRGEGWNNFAFQPAADDVFLLGRLLLQADMRFNETVRLFVQGKSALATHRDLPGGTRTLDVDTLALQQAYLDLHFRQSSSELSLLGGRQALTYGRERLLSPLPWGNTLRAWDGGLLRLVSGAWKVDAFYTWYVPVDKYDANRREENEPFGGIYAHYTVEPDRGLDLYWLRRERVNVAFNGTTGDERRNTFGARLFHQKGPWRGDLELAYQHGEVGTGDTGAAMVALEIRRFWDEGWAESIAVGLDYASGDDAPGGDVETFDQLYPLGHAYLGYIDYIGRQNIRSGFLRGRFRVAARTMLEVTALTFARDSTRDAVYNPLSGVLRPGNASPARHIGEELDITLTTPLGSAGRLLIGYSHFFPGDFIETSGPSAASDFGYVQYLLNF